MQLVDVTQNSLPTLSTRAAESHKGDYGRVLVIGGSRGKAGAVALAGMATLRSGAGLVTVAVPRSIQAVVAGFEPSMMTLGLGDAESDELGQESIPELREILPAMTCLALGPGMGTSPGSVRLTHWLYHRVAQPMVVDADGLNALSTWPEGLRLAYGPRILTPHPGEFQRLTGEKCADDLNKRADQAATLCRLDPTGNTILVLKGHRTLVTDGRQVSFNPTGNPGMATGGSGDVLTGTIAGLLAQGMGPFESARLGVQVHGLAGDRAAKEVGEISLIASDLLRFLPVAFQQGTVTTR